MSTLHSCATRGIHRHRPTRGQRPVKPLRSLLAFAALGAAALPSVTRADSAVVISPLATPGQLEVEDAAIALLADPAVVNAREAALELFEADPTAATADGKATLVQAVDELVFDAALSAVNNDPSRPRAVWVAVSPHYWFGHEVPGSRWGIDNPDNVYRDIPVNVNSSYEIIVHPHKVGPVTFSFFIYDSYAGEGGKVADLDKPVAGLRDVDIEPDPDGSFTVTVDATPANGRPNHIQNTSAGVYLLYRNTFDQWAEQTPQDVEVRVVGGPQSVPQTHEVIVQTAVELINAAASTVETIKRGVLSLAPNTISTPSVRGGNWGFAASGHWQVADDEAVVVNIDPSGAKYLGFDLTDAWLVSRPHIDRTGSLNDHQAVPNADGTYTYVIATQDPGYANWADTGGIHEGAVTLRWQGLPADITSIAGAVKAVNLIKLSDLAASLPAGFPTVTPAERRAADEARAASYAHRYAGALNLQ